MRLIDADKIRYTSSFADDEIFVAKSNKVTEYEIDMMPTVEAIPIEWLECLKWIYTDIAFRVIQYTISEWNGDNSILIEAEAEINNIFRKVMQR